MSIYILKLTSGIELITDLDMEDSESLFEQILTMDTPLTFGLMKGKDGQQQVGFYPYLTSEPEANNIKLNGRSVESYLIESGIGKDLVKEYKNRTNKIQLL
jgi:hypothetical protein